MLESVWFKKSNSLQAHFLNLNCIREIKEIQ